MNKINFMELRNNKRFKQILDDERKVGAKEELEELKWQMDCWFPDDFYKSHERVLKLIQKRLEELDK
jgi:hypothetical protein